MLRWNIRGINSNKKWEAVRSKILESQCDIACIQETKREHFDDSYIHNFCPYRFDCFEYLPSRGASGGSLLLGKGPASWGQKIFQNDSAFSVELMSLHLGA